MTAATVSTYELTTLDTADEMWLTEWLLQWLECPNVTSVSVTRDETQTGTAVTVAVSAQPTDVQPTKTKCNRQLSDALRKYVRAVSASDRLQNS
ncbi:hypothetical protein [Natronocalculus amylovorans]|uniref:Uncharacterized protein n=1 Tax=Natronocalculus amylovorans TaxID=2917812 RepID=A0AAE3G161_9EURY|nr:hypothetical protein [Natronocalculus amylovorans]MCL9818074.1 hypothetical protein [Natronocalculus amylovorans]NUE03931.1 hypothetical protein [Halorubraceae archaeon YAN]